MADTPWWRGAVVYHVYVRSFFDSNGDGQGDLPGVEAKLDYIKSLGVDAVWLSPIHPSPNRDWGYDVADYHAVQHDYGTLEDFQRLLDSAHSKALKIILDEVLAHTSDEHEWFKDSMRRGEKADWYVWADPREDGTAPNNWLSAFGGPAWAYQPARRQHYHHKFLRQQPKLNWRNPDAKAAALGVLDFWLAKGVDGFRLDVANAYLHDDRLTDNPAVPVPQRSKWHWSHAANLQEHWHDSNLIENHQVLDEVRRVVERYDDRFVFGEFSEEAGRCGGFAASDEGLHAGYSFPLLIASKPSPEFILKHFEELSKHPDHWPCISFSNHDVPRTLTRFGGKDAPPELARMMLALLLTLRGTTLLYQGEELGLPEADLTREQLKDPVGDLYWPVHKGRDGCRTPMPWSREPKHGFTTGSPWLPAAPEHVGLTVEDQEADPDSTLALARKLIALRNEIPALRVGEIEFLDLPAPLLGFSRDLDSQRVVCTFGMGPDPIHVSGGETLAQQEGPYGFRIALY